jgi:nucleotidyltransferase substrate binding protein (TIGR01987 family)
MKKYENFCAALLNLKDLYKCEEPYSNVILTGLVGLYEICFEQAWKAMKEILENHGFEESKTGSPKQILKTAYQANMIQDEELWLDALVSRNNVTHSYNRAIALDIVNRTKKDYFMLFETLKKELEEKWL